jgi:WD40 repeat protein
MEIKEKRITSLIFVLLHLLLLNLQSYGMFTVFTKKNANQPSHLNKNPLTPTQKEKIKLLQETIQIKSMDGELISAPLLIAQKGKVLESCLKDQVNSNDPIPLPYSSAVIKDAISDVMGISLNNDSLNQLVQKFEFLYRYDFPSEIVKQSLKEMTSKIDATNLDEIIKSKKIVEKLDPNIPDLQDFLVHFQQKSDIPFTSIEASQKNIIYIPKSITTMSDYLNTATSSKWQQKEDDIAIKLPNYSASFLSDIFSMIEKKESMPIAEHIKNYSLGKLIKIVNCLDYLAFTQDIQQPFYSKIYLLSKKIPLSDPSSELLTHLSPHAVQKIFIDQLTKKLQHLMVRKCIKERYIDVPLHLETDESLHAMAFSPNNTTFLFAKGKSGKNEDNIFSCNINENEIQFNDQPIISEPRTITAMAFSPDGKLMVTGSLGTKENLFAYNVDQNTIESTYQTLEGHFSDISNILFHPSGNVMISASQGKEEKLATKEAKHSLLLWKIENGKIQNTPTPLSAHLYGVDKIILSPDGSTMISMNTNQENDNFIWNFDKSGNLVKGPRKFSPSFIQDVALMPDNNKIIVSQDHTKLVLYDMLNFSSNTFVHKTKQIFIENNPFASLFNKFSISPDSSTLFSLPGRGYYGPYIPINLFSIINYEHILFTSRLKISPGKSKGILYSKDSNIIASLNTKGSLRFTTLFTKEERSQLNKLNNLNVLQALHIDHLVDIQEKKSSTYKPSELDEITNYEKLDLPIEVKQLFEKVDIDILPSLKQTIKNTLTKHLDSGDLMSVIRTLDSQYKDKLERKTFTRTLKEMGLSHLYLKHHKESPEFTAEKLKHSPEAKEFAQIKEAVRKQLKKSDPNTLPIRALKRQYQDDPRYQKALEEILAEMNKSHLLGPTPLERILDALGLSRFKKYVE